MINSPDFLIHNSPDSNDFNVAQVTDLTLAGEYTVTIQSEIQMPDDYTMSTFTPVISEHDFKVFINPCKV